MRPRGTLPILLAAAAAAGCGIGHPASTAPRSPHHPPPSIHRDRGNANSPTTTTTTATTGIPAHAPRPVTALPTPAPLVPFAGTSTATWSHVGRLVDGMRAVYQTSLVPPGGTVPAGVAWMDTGLLSARLYSGSISPGGGPYRYTAPVEPSDAGSLVAAFNGGFKMATAGGGYYTEGRLVAPLRTGAASLVIYANGSVDVGAWGTDVTMTPNVVAVRQNLVPLVSNGRPTPEAMSPDWQAWGNTCGATSCTPGVPGIEHQWRSGVGVTADGALVYVTGPTLAPTQLAQLLVRVGVVRGMELDINPYWTVLVTYDPIPPNGPASPSNGSRLVASTVQGPATFFNPLWARDFVTMSVR
jgi:Phosphodiester glycosidase